MKKSSYIVAGTIAGVIGVVGLAGAVQANRDGDGGNRHHFGKHERHDASWRHNGGRHGWRGHRRGHHGGHGKGAMMMHMFALADANKDGKVTQDEIDTARDERFAKYDSNNDGKLSLEEYQDLYVEIMQPMIVRSFQRLDPNGDAQVEKTEFDRPTERLVERFDRNDDGALSRDDRRGHGRHGWRKHGRHHERGHHRDKDANGKNGNDGDSDSMNKDAN